MQKSFWNGNAEASPTEDTGIADFTEDSANTFFFMVNKNFFYSLDE